MWQVHIVSKRNDHKGTVTAYIWYLSPKKNKIIMYIMCDNVNAIFEKLLLDI